MAEIASLKYRAFLSYSHADVGWARWLHSRLEAFRIDKDLVGRATPLGPVPNTLRPIFRNREDFTGGSRWRCCSYPGGRQPASSSAGIPA